MLDDQRRLNQIVTGHLLVALLAIAALVTGSGPTLVLAGLGWAATYFGEGFVLAGHKTPALICYWLSIVFPVAAAVSFVSINSHWF